MAPPTVVVVDTTFARVDMGTIVLQRIGEIASPSELATQRFTVPGFKDLAAVARRVVDQGAAIVIACGMPGPEPIDESCAGDASLGLQLVQALTGTSVLEVFVHTTEAIDGDGRVDEDVLAALCRRRCRGHAENAVRMVLDPAAMVGRAGTGRRQGSDDEEAIPVRR